MILKRCAERNQNQGTRIVISPRRKPRLHPCRIFDFRASVQNLWRQRSSRKIKRGTRQNQVPCNPRDLVKGMRKRRQAERTTCSVKGACPPAENLKAQVAY